MSTSIGGKFSTISITKSSELTLLLESLSEELSIFTFLPEDLLDEELLLFDFLELDELLFLDFPDTSIFTSSGF